MTGHIRIGISGWTYAPWRASFFPRGLIHREELAYASNQVSSIEINGTFYSLQRPSSFAKWYEQTPSGFVFSVKAPRFITHVRRLKDCSIPVANFFASGILRLKEKLGPILWQLPPSLPFDANRLEDFLALLPYDTDAAIKLAKKHDDRITDAWVRSDERRPLRHALEVRHASFGNSDFIGLLRQYNVALVVADTAGKWPYMEDVTADFIYVRLHGDEELYVSGYTESALQQWAKRITRWSNGRNIPRGKLRAAPARISARGRDVFVYFDNDVKIRAPYDAMNLAFRLGVGPKPPDAPSAKSISEVPRPNWPALHGNSNQPGKARTSA